MPDDLESLSGVGPATADKLRSAGYRTFKTLATAMDSDLSDEADIGDSKAKKIIQAAREEADIGGFNSGVELMEKRNQVGRLRLNVPEFDNLMGGGFETKSISEVYGEFGAGKSQITQQLAVNVQLPKEDGGLDGGCIFVDTEDTFRPSRIGEMVRGLDEEILEDVIEDRGFDMTVSEVKDSRLRDDDGKMDSSSPAGKLAASFLDDIHVAKAQTSGHQILLGETLTDQAEDVKQDEDRKDVRLIVFDSLTAHFRAEYAGRGELANRQQNLNKHLHDILTAADLYNSVALITNQVSANPDQYFGDPTQPIGGNILAHTSNFRVYLRKSKDNKRVAKLVDAPDLPDGEALFKVVSDGVVPE